MRLSTFCAITLLTGCSSHYTVVDLAGKYVLSVGEGFDTIELGEKGTYTHTYEAKSGRAEHQEGTWTLEDLQAGSTVVLNNFRPLLGENVRGEGIYLLTVKKSFGSVYLITNIDLNEGYKRQF